MSERVFLRCLCWMFFQTLSKIFLLNCQLLFWDGFVRCLFSRTCFGYNIFWIKILPGVSVRLLELLRWKRLWKRRSQLLGLQLGLTAARNAATVQAARSPAGSWEAGHHSMINREIVDEWCIEKKKLIALRTTVTKISFMQGPNWHCNSSQLYELQGRPAY